MREAGRRGSRCGILQRLGRRPAHRGFPADPISLGVGLRARVGHVGYRHFATQPLIASIGWGARGATSRHFLHGHFAAQPRSRRTARGRRRRARTGRHLLHGRFTAQPGCRCGCAWGWRWAGGSSRHLLHGHFTAQPGRRCRCTLRVSRTGGSSRHLLHGGFTTQPEGRIGRRRRRLACGGWRCRPGWHLLHGHFAP